MGVVFGGTLRPPVGVGFSSGLDSGGGVAALLTHRLMAGIPLGWPGLGRARGMFSEGVGVDVGVSKLIVRVVSRHRSNAINPATFPFLSPLQGWGNLREVADDPGL